MSFLSDYKSIIEETPVGGIVYVLSSEVSRYEQMGFLKADGSIVQQSDYPHLFSKIGHINSPYFIGEIPTRLTFWQGSSADASRTDIPRITYGNGVYIVGSAWRNGYPLYFRSTNAINWTQFFIWTTDGSSTVADTNLDLIYGNGIFLTYPLKSDTNDYFTSTNGINWTNSGTLDAKFSYKNGKFYAVGTTGNSSISTNAINWTTFNATEVEGYIGDAKVDKFDRAIFQYQDGNFAVTTDGVNWNYFHMDATLDPSMFYDPFIDKFGCQTARTAGNPIIYDIDDNVFYPLSINANVDSPSRSFFDPNEQINVVLARPVESNFNTFDNTARIRGGLVRPNLDSNTVYINQGNKQIITAYAASFSNGPSYVVINSGSLITYNMNSEFRLPFVPCPSLSIYSMVKVK